MKLRFNNVYFSTPVPFLPETIISSEQIEARLDSLYSKLKLPHGRLELMTGIKERRMWEPGTKPSFLSTQVGNKLIESLGVDRSEIGLLTHSSVCRDFLEPATASVVHHGLGLDPNCMIFDLSNACLGVLSGMTLAAKMIESGAIKKALIVSGENGGPLIENTLNELLNDPTITRKSIKKYIANLTIGSAAVAVLLSGEKNQQTPHRLVGGSNLTDSEAHVLCQGDGDPQSLSMQTDSEKLLAAGIRLASNNINEFYQALEWTKADLNYAIGHQVGKAHEEQTMSAMDLKDIETMTTYDFLGNTGSAALPVTLAHLAANKEMNSGDKIALLGIGSGLTSIMLGAEW
jgi:3-oxoacyl-[acyl-carrier-protein] synthase III